MCEGVANDIIQYVNKKPNSLIVLPGGDTPLRVFECFIKAVDEGKVDFSKCSFVSLDEWKNFGYNHKGSCKQTLFDQFYKKLPIDLNKQICFFRW